MAFISGHRTAPRRLLLVAAMLGACVASGCPYVTGLDLKEGSSTVAIDAIFREAHVVVSQNGEVLCEGLSDPNNGHFPCDMGVVDGDVDICVDGGRYYEAASQQERATHLNAPLCTRLPVVFLEAHTVIFTPWTPLVAATARAWLKNGAPAALPTASTDFTTYGEAHGAAAQAWNRFLGACAMDTTGVLPNVVETQPRSPAQWEPKVAGYTPARLAGALAAGLSELTASHNRTAPVGQLTDLTTPALLQSLVADLADGQLSGADDPGRSGGTPIKVRGYELSSHTLRAELAQAIHRAFAPRANDAAPATSLPWHPPRRWLACLSQHEGPLFNTAGTPLDIDGPEISFLAPDTHKPRSGRVDISVDAFDPSQVVALDIELEGAPADTADTPQKDALHEIAKALPNKHGTLRAWLDSAQLADGLLTLKITATDSLGHATVARRDILLNNAGPDILVTTPRPDEKVTGTIVFEATAQDDAYTIANLILEHPPEVSDQDPNPDRFVGNWDSNTRAPGDGPLTVRFTATDSLGMASAAEVPIELDNYATTTLKGEISLGAPVRGATIQAIALSPYGVRSNDALAEAQTTDGNYTLELPDSYQGWVLLRAYGNTTRVQDPRGKRELQFGPADELLTFFHHTLAPAHRTLTPIPINAATTLATAYAAADLGGRGAQAWTLFGEHLWATPHLDQTTVHPWLGTATQDVPAAPSLYLGLIHIGLSHLAARRGHEVDAFVSPLDLLRKLKADIADGVFDGLASDGQPITWAPHTTQALTANTLRSELAQAIGAWLNSAPGEADSPPSSAQDQLEHLGAGAMFAPGGFLDSLSLNQSGLFAKEPPPEPYDGVPPTVTVSNPAKMNADDNGWVSLLVTASDDHLDTLAFFHDGAPIHGEPQPKKGPNWWRFSVGCKASSRFEARATDRAGNVGSADTTVTCDDTPPHIESRSSAVTLEEVIPTADHASYIYGGPTIDLATHSQPWPLRKFYNRLDDLPDRVERNIPRIRFAVDDPTATVRYRYFSPRGHETPPWKQLIRVEDAYAIPIAYQTLGPELAWSTPQQRHAIEIQATDTAGNKATERFEFHLTVLVPPPLVPTCQNPTWVGDPYAGFVQGIGPGIGTYQVRWPLDLPAGTAAPQVPLQVAPNSDPMVAHVVSATGLINYNDSWAGPQYTQGSCLGKRGIHFELSDGTCISTDPAELNRIPPLSIHVDARIIASDHAAGQSSEQRITTVEPNRAYALEMTTGPRELPGYQTSIPIIRVAGAPGSQWYSRERMVLENGAWGWTTPVPTLNATHSLHNGAPLRELRKHTCPLPSPH